MWMRDTKKAMLSSWWNTMNPNEQRHAANQPVFYQIRIKGHLGQQWMDWFDGLTVTLEEEGCTLLTGPMIDQAALHGILKKVRDLGMPLLSVSSVGVGPQETSEIKP
jgi:hypothetical protein